MTFHESVFHELTQNILPFWIKNIDYENGGYYGEVDKDGIPNLQASKGGILTARILWTFSHAYRLLGGEAYLQAATYAYHFLLNHFWDPKYGGTYWNVDYRGSVLESKKQIYAQAFTIYGLSEYYLAVKDDEARKKAICLFEIIEEQAYDPINGGYFESFSRDWSLAKDFRLSEKEYNDPKTMNTHLHILESYTNLLHAWDDHHLRQQHKYLIDAFLSHIINPDTNHFFLFFNDFWKPRNMDISYGHDIEGSWLLSEAAGLLGESKLREKVITAAHKMADAVYKEAIDIDGAIYYEVDSDGNLFDQKEWWAEAEAVVGFYNAYQITGDNKFLQASFHAWQFIENNMIDTVHGEWYRTVTRQGSPIMSKLVDFWKCPYHSGRACMEIFERTSDPRRL